MKYLLGLFAFILVLNSSAQEDRVLTGNFKKDHKKAVKLWLYDYNYMEALPIFEGLLEQQPDNDYLKFALGDCYMNHPSKKHMALGFLKDASKNVTESMEDFKFESYKTTKAPYDAFRVLGMAYRLNYEFDNAINAFNKYKELVGEAELKKGNKDIEREIRMCKTAKLLVKFPIDIKVTSLGETINSKYPDYAPVLSADEKTLMFTSRRGKEGDLTDPVDFGFYEKIYISEKNSNGDWSKPKSLSYNVNTPKSHVATVGLSVDGQQLLIYSAKDNPNGDIYYTKLDGDQWIEPIAFDAINSKESEVDACFNVDGSAIYFSSNRPGGYGGFDIYKIIRLPNGTWSLPQNLGPKVNTERNERAPFKHPDGVSLFFASDGHETMGGYDIFQTIDNEEGSWTTPENIGYPINTTDDDVFYVTSVDGKRAYYSSAKLDGVGEKDIYMLEIQEEEVEEKPLTVMSGSFTLSGTEGSVPENAQIMVTDNESGEIVGIYRPNSKSGKYLFILPSGKNYNVSYEAEGYLFKSENLVVPKNTAFQTINKEIKLAPIKANQSIVLNNVFFEFASAELTKDSKTELEKLKNLLEVNSSIRVEISGHTDSKGSKKINDKLSKERAVSVKEYLVKNGINESRIVAVGYGSNRPIARNKNEDGTDNPEGRQLNRRIELSILSNDGSMDDVVNDIDVPDELKDKKKK